LSLCVARLEQECADEQCAGSPDGEHAEARPGADGWGAQVGGGLDRLSGVHRPDLLEESLPVRVADDLRQDRGEVEQAEDCSDGCGGVFDGGGDSKAEIPRPSSAIRTR
jgi:hypothetical protein